MRNVIYSINISTDGCYDHTKFDGGSEEIHNFFASQMQDCQEIVFGRKMYELMFPFWSDYAKAQKGPQATIDFAETITNIDKIVFSKTLTHAEANTRIMRDGLADEIRRLKQLPGKKISVSGMDLCLQLTELGLIDEYYFVVHPIIVGAGPRLLERLILHNNLSLKLADKRMFSSGAVGLHYIKA